MKWTMLFLFLAVSASAAVIGNTRCAPVEMNGAGTEWVRMKCNVTTDDIGVFEVVVVSTTSLRMRVNGDGSIASGDLAGVRTAIRAAYQSRISEARIAKTAEDALEAKRAAARLTLTPAQVE